MEEGFEIFFDIETNIEPSGIISCHIPFYDLYYDAKDEIEVKLNGKAMMNSYINNLVREDNRKVN